MAQEIYPIGTNVIAEDYNADELICGLVTKIRSERYEMRYLITWCDGDQHYYTFDQVCEMANDYKTKMDLW